MHIITIDEQENSSKNITANHNYCITRGGGIASSLVLASCSKKSDNKIIFEKTFYSENQIANFINSKSQNLNYHIPTPDDIDHSKSGDYNTFNNGDKVNKITYSGLSSLNGVYEIKFGTASDYVTLAATASESNDTSNVTLSHNGNDPITLNNFTSSQHNNCWAIEALPGTLIITLSVDYFNILSTNTTTVPSSNVPQFIFNDPHRNFSKDYGISSFNYLFNCINKDNFYISTLYTLKDVFSKLQIYEAELSVQHFGDGYRADFLAHIVDNPGTTAIATEFFSGDTFILNIGGSGGFSYNLSVPNKYQAPTSSSYYDSDASAYEVIGLGSYISEFEEIDDDPSLTHNAYSVQMIFPSFSRELTHMEFFII